MKKLICEASTKDDSRPRIRTIFLKRKKHRNLLENLVIPKFDIDSTEDQIKLNEIKEKIKETNKQTYKNILETWTIRDVKKFNKAKENNLNYLAFYTEKEMIKWIENELKNN